MTATYKISNDITLGKKVYNGVITVGAAGAVTSFTGEGIVSVTKETTAGQYTIKLSDINSELTFVSLLNAGITLSGAALDDLTFHVAADTLSSADTVKIQAHTAGTEANATSGNKIHFTFEVACSY